MSKGTTKATRALLPLLGRLERYMARAGLIAFMAEPVAAPAAAPVAAPAAAPAVAAPAPAATMLGGDPPPAPVAAPAAAPVAAPAVAEAKPAEGTEAVKPGEEAKPPGAPEKYEFKLPDTLTADTPVVGKFSEWAKANNLPQDKAQAVVDMVAELQAGNAEALKTATTEFYADIGGMPDTWIDQAKADKEFGGDKLDESRAVAKAALDEFGTPALKALFNKTGIGNHPEVIRAFVRAGKAISQDGFVPGRTGATRKDTASVLYGSTSQSTTH